jgi:hypothetical protein
MSELQSPVEFDIERNPDAERLWYAACEVRGTGAVGCGDTAWEAIADCITRGLPEAIRFAEQMDAHMELARRGEAQCPGCGALRPALTPETKFWAFFCDDCRGDEDDE